MNFSEEFLKDIIGQVYGKECRTLRPVIMRLDSNNTSIGKAASVDEVFVGNIRGQFVMGNADPDTLVTKQKNVVDVNLSGAQSAGYTGRNVCEFDIPLVVFERADIVGAKGSKAMFIGYSARFDS